MLIGSLFTGYGGLDIAVQSVLGGDLAWYSEIDKAACQVLAAHHPGVPNLGDITNYGDCGCDDLVPWDHFRAVDILTAGYPCQPFSSAGNRKGKDDERHLWPYVRDAIGALEPRLVVLENVRGHLSMGLADVIGDLAALGYDATWGVVRASDAGAPHGRARVFVVAHPAGDGHRRVNATRGADGVGVQGIRAGLAGRGVPAADAEDDGRTGVGAARGRGARPADGDTAVDWGRYADAIRRWERVTGRPAPRPTVLRPNGKQRLSSRFDEWLMGLPDGYVTGHGLPYTAEIKLCGNGVVPQQAALALRMLGVGA